MVDKERLDNAALDTVCNHVKCGSTPVVHAYVDYDPAHTDTYDGGYCEEHVYMALGTRRVWVSNTLKEVKRTTYSWKAHREYLQTALADIVAEIEIHQGQPNLSWLEAYRDELAYLLENSPVDVNQWR